MAFTGKPKGLANLGNTCYLNTMLQCVNACGFINLLRDKIKCDEESKEPSPHEAMYIALRKVFKDLNNEQFQGIYSPKAFVSTLQANAVKLGRPDFAGWQQNDVAELYTLLGECIHEATRNKASVSVNIQDESKVTPIDSECLSVLTKYLKDEYSVAGKALAGVECSVMTSMDGSYLSSHGEIFYIMAVPVPQNATNVQDCVNAARAEVALTGDNKYAMPDNAPNPGELVDALQRNIIWMAPQFLVVETRLYNFDARTGHVQKGWAKLNASPVLELGVWSSNSEARVKYLLCGVAYHRGGNSQGGHYVAVVRNSQGQLWNCNDTIVSPLARGSGWPVGGYCFFYRKIL